MTRLAHRPTVSARARLRTALPALAFAIVLLGGCLPRRVTLDLAPGPVQLDESTVIADDGARSGPKVALIAVSGFLIDAQLPGLVGTMPSPVDELVARLGRAAEDRDVRAVVLRVNSPGGTVTGSDIMAREVRRFADRTGKPVVASMGEIATSGGYYLSIAADRVVAEPTTVTASIGVIIQTFNVSGGMEMLGIRARALTSGANKDLANPFQREREGQFAVLQTMVDDFYAGFRSHVLTRRAGFDAAAQGEYLDGRVITGAEAARVGLVDELGGVREAYGAAKKLAGLERARLVAYHSEFDRVRTPYGAPAAHAAPHGRPGASGDINLVQIHAPGLFDTPPGGGFFYLWTPSAP